MRWDLNLDSSILTFILAGGRGKRLSPLTSGKAKPLVPFGGAFRIIDFTLSNCVNSGLERAYLLTQYKAETVRQYIETSSWKTEFICTPPQPTRMYRGTADSVYQNLELFRYHNADYVLVLAADHIYKMDYRKLIRFHASHGGDATIAAVQYPLRLSQELGILNVDERGQVVGFEEKPEHPTPRIPGSSSVLASMGVYVFNASAIRRALLRNGGDFNGSHEFGSHLLPNLIRTDRVFAYDFSNNGDPLGNYWRDVGTVDSYHRTHMELLLMNFNFDPYSDARWPIYSRGTDRVFRSSTTESRTVDSLISPSAEISDATITQSVVSPLVQVATGTQIVGSVLMRGAQVGRDARVRRAIIDEGVCVPEGAVIGWDAAEDSRHHFVTDKGVVVVQAPNRSAFRASSSPAGRRSQAVHI